MEMPAALGPAGLIVPLPTLAGQDPDQVLVLQDGTLWKDDAAAARRAGGAPLQRHSI